MSKKDTTSRFELDGEALEIDVADLTFGEIEIIEEYFDKSFDDVDLESGRGLLVIAFLAKRRKDPNATLDDLRDVKVNAIKEVKKQRPTKAQGGGSGPRR